ncbi:IS4 family transposase [Coxiella burnetii]|nr:IS4 family transposase [Coxiella burnetii]
MEFNKGLKKFKQAFSETALNELGKQVKFAQKLRKITPFRLALSLISSFAGKIQTIADTHRTFNELNEEHVQYKPYHKQLAKRAFPNFMRRVVCRLMSEFACRTLTINDHNPFSMFEHIFIHDGSSYAIKSNLKSVFPGKYKQGLATVQLHTTMDLLADEITAVILAPFSHADVNYLPSAKEIKNSLLLLDRAYLDFSYLREVDTHQGFFIVRGKRHMNPMIEQGYDSEVGIFTSLSGVN